jgi:MFS transporter, DHA2 family, multidrug resistance protein
VPVMLLLLLVGPRLLPEYRDPNAGRPDFPSTLLSLITMLSVIYGLKRLAEAGLAVVPLFSLVFGLLVGAVFVRRQLALDDPLIDLRLFRVPAFTASLLTYGLSILTLFGGFLFLPQYLQLVRGLSPFAAGLWTLPWAFAFVVGSLLTPRLSRRFRPHVLMSLGLVAGAFGFGVFAFIDEGTTFWTFAGATTLFSLGLSPVFTLTTDLIVGAAPPEHAGAAAAMSETSAELGGALGIAVFGSIGIAVYRSEFGADALGLLEPSAREAAVATLGGAVTSAAELPAQVGAAVLASARSAFIDGIRLCAALSCSSALILAVFVWRGLRRGPEPDAQQGEPATLESS